MRARDSSAYRKAIYCSQMSVRSELGPETCFILVQGGNSDKKKTFKDLNLNLIFEFKFKNFS